MNLTRTLTIGAAGGGLVTWLSWAAAPAAPRLDAQPARARAVEQSGAALAREIARLHERLRPDTTPSYTRNVFAFPPPQRLEPAPAAQETRAPALAMMPAPPKLTLVGMAEDERADGVMRTAIVSGGGALYLVTVGDELLARFRVEQLSADAALLRDLETGAEVYLALQ